MIPARFAPYLFGLIVSGLMSLLVSGIATFKTLGMFEGLLEQWMHNWSFCWAVAFPTVLVVAPLARRIVARLTTQPKAEERLQA